MKSREWLLKLFSNIVFVFVFVFMILFIYLVHDKFQNNALLHKEYLVKEYKPKVIFSGDSRSERQLNVESATELLNLNDGEVVNIAISSGDPIMISNLIDKYPSKFQNAILFLSISANQMNDNAKAVGYFTDSMISKLDLHAQISTFFPNNVETLFRYYLHIVQNYIKDLAKINQNSNEFMNTFGFNGIDKKLDINNIKLNILEQNPWYQNYSDGGMKYQLVEKSLIKIKKNTKSLYVYTAPFSPRYIEVIKNSNLLKNEISFKSRIKDICENNRIKYKNYLVVDELEDRYFYDVAHVNIEGSRIFTKTILTDFMKINLNKSTQREEY